MRGLDYSFVVKCVGIAHALRAHYGDRVHARLRDAIVARCFDDRGALEFFVETLHGHCMFSLIHKIEPHLLPGTLEF